MDIVDVLDKLSESGVSVWLDQDGELRISTHASAELKELVRAHKENLINVRKAQAIMNRPGMRCIRLPLGHLAVAYPLKAGVSEIRWAMRVLRMDSMSLVINDEGVKWVPYRDYPAAAKRRKSCCTARPEESLVRSTGTLRA